MHDCAHQVLYLMECCYKPAISRTANSKEIYGLHKLEGAFIPDEDFFITKNYLVFMTILVKINAWHLKVPLLKRVNHALIAATHY